MIVGELKEGQEVYVLPSQYLNSGKGDTIIVEIVGDDNWDEIVKGWNKKYFADIPSVEKEIDDKLPSEKILCQDCGSFFYLTSKNKKWFEDRDFHIPKRCEFCRKAKKAERAGRVFDTGVSKKY